MIPKWKDSKDYKLLTVILNCLHSQQIFICQHYLHQSKVSLLTNFFLSKQKTQIFHAVLNLPRSGA